MDSYSGRTFEMKSLEQEIKIIINKIRYKYIDY